MLKKIISTAFLLGGFLFVQAQCSVDLGPDTALCPGESLDLSVNLQAVGDSLQITYDATQGVSGLSGASKVYFHSGAELMPFAGWQYPVGDWGQDNGVGEMSSIGNDLWQITIHPENYYGLPANSSINGIFMVFRNADGSQTGKDNSDNDIFLNMTTNPPSSSFGGISGSIFSGAVTSILWSTGATGSQISLITGGTYWVNVTDSSGCVASDTVFVAQGQLPLVDLGPSPTICSGVALDLDAGPGFQSYAWSTGAATPSITVASPGLYTVTVTNADGCAGSDIVFVDAGQLPTAAFATTSGASIDFQNNSVGGDSYAWDFDGDGSVDDTTANPAAWTPPGTGSYSCTLVVSNGCGSDTSIQTINFAVASLDAAPRLEGGAWFSQAGLVMDFRLPAGGKVEWEVADLWGRVVSKGSETASPGDWRKEVGMAGQASGVYMLRIRHRESAAHFKLIFLNH